MIKELEKQLLAITEEKFRASQFFREHFYDRSLEEYGLEKFRLDLLEGKYDSLIWKITINIIKIKDQGIYYLFSDQEIEEKQEIQEIKDYTLAELKQRQDEEFYLKEANKKLDIKRDELEEFASKYDAEVSEIIKEYKDKLSEENIGILNGKANREWI